MCSASIISKLQQMRVVVRLLDRLRRKAEVFRMTRSVCASARGTRNATLSSSCPTATSRAAPGEPALDEREFQPGELLERALGDETDHLRLERLGHAGVPL